MRVLPLHALAHGVDPILGGDMDLDASLGGLGAAGLMVAGGLVWAVVCVVATLARRRARVHNVERRVTAAVARERSRLARELHDVVGHGLLVITMHARQPAVADPQARQSLDSIEETAQRTLGEMRRIVGTLRRREADDRAEPRALSSHIAATIAELPWTAQAVRFEVVGAERPLARETQTVALRVVQEGLSNAFKHGSDAPVQVCVQFGAELVVSVTTGRGPTPPAAPAPAGSGYGLAGLRERITARGGRFECEALPGGEFRIRARLPLASPGGWWRATPARQRHPSAHTGAAAGGTGQAGRAGHAERADHADRAERAGSAGRVDRDGTRWIPLRARGLALIGARGRERR